MWAGLATLAGLQCAHDACQLTLQLGNHLLLLLDGAHLLAAWNDAVHVAAEVACLVAEQLGRAVHTNNLLRHWAVEHSLQELVAADGFSFLDDQAGSARGDDVHVANQIWVVAVTQVVLVQALDGWCDDVVVDIADDLLDALASVADEHGQARRCAASASAALTRHVARNHGVLVRACAELLEHGHQLCCVAVGLEEADGRCVVSHLGGSELPNLPWVHVRDVLARGQAAHVHTNLWA